MSIPSQANSETWRRIVLKSMSPPAWLAADAADLDVVISSRVRFARNLFGYRYPHAADPADLNAILDAVRSAARRCQLEEARGMTPAEFDYLVGCRLVSPDFAYGASGRGLFFDSTRAISVMVNEEDHLRIQCLSAGWSAHEALDRARRVESNLGSNLRWAWHERWGFLNASPSNMGPGLRASAMLHLIGIAQTNRLRGILRALTERHIVVRGLFGESSRALGAMVQVSSVEGVTPEFVGACTYLVEAERAARTEVDVERVAEQARMAAEFAVTSRGLKLADALRVLAWSRWASCLQIPGFPPSPRDVDQWLTSMEVRSTHDSAGAARHRAEFLRARLERTIYGPAQASNVGVKP